MKKTQELKIRELLGNNEKYVIPLYQRNYDWGSRETLQLLDDIADYAKKKKNGQPQNYYIGTLVVHELENGHEIIDGQQRMTTLTLLLCAVKNDKTLCDNIDLSWFNNVNLSYINRDKANETIRNLFEGNTLSISIPSMKEVYLLIQNSLSARCAEKSIDVSDFMDYLLKDVHILQVVVPDDTDLNHYFEIMNSRGEQLEKHEIVKAMLMGNVKETIYHEAFNAIWEACSNMNSYVSRNFSNNKIKQSFFREDNTIKPGSFKELANDVLLMGDYTESLSDNDAEETQRKSISDLIDEARNNKHYPAPAQDSRQEGERFSSIINFPNFLLHVLKIVYHEWFKNQEDDGIISLDDKELVDIFGNVLHQVDGNNVQGFVLTFIHQLLRLRYLFDKYVIKREDSGVSDERNTWSLKTINKDNNYVLTFGENDSEDDTDTGIQIRMLETMFHVSAPTQSSKYWLLAVLNYINESEPVKASNFSVYLFQLAKDYIRYRYLCNTQSEFFDIIFNHKNLPQTRVDDLDWEKLNKGTRVPHFVFNYYDYILWHSHPSDYNYFNFTYRSSVEHFYPQHPIDNNRELDNVDYFGNLCLISSSVNSKFSNNMPKAKLENFGKIGAGKYSIKLHELFKEAEKDVVWDEHLIDELTEECTNKIKESL